MIFFDKTKSTLYKFLVYYLVILSLPILFNIYANHQASNIIREEIFKSRAGILSQTRLHIDNVLSDVYNYIAQIGSNNRLNAFLLQKQPFNNLNHYEIYQITQDLSPYSAHNPLIVDIIVYCFNSNIILSPGAVYPDWLYYTRRMSFQNRNFLEWKDDLRRNAAGRRIVVDTPIIDNKEKKSIFLSQTLPITSFANNSGILQIVIDEQEIRNILTSYINGYIIDKSGQIISTNIPLEKLPVIPLEKLQGKDGFFTISFRGEKYMVSYISSQLTDWKYINVEHEEVFLEKVHYQSRNFVFIVVLCGILGIILSYFLSKKSYSPINRVIEFITKSTGMTTPRETRNEMEFIRDVFINAVRNNARMEEELKKMMNQISQKERIGNLVSPDNIGIADNIIKGIIQSGISQNTPPLQNFLQLYGINFSNKRFLVILIQVDDCSKFVLQNEETNDRKIIHSAIKSILEELLKSGLHFGYVINLDRDIMGALVNLNDKTEQKTIVKDINTYTAKLCDFMTENLSSDISIGIGRIYYSLDDINLSYQDAKSALDFRVIGEPKQIIWYDTILENDKEYNYPIDIELKLVRALRAADLDRCKILINEILEENFKRRTMTLRMAQYVTFTMINTALRTLAAMNIDADNILGKNAHFLNRITNFKNEVQLHNEIVSIYESICHYLINNKVHITNNRIKNEALVYIRSHFSDINFSQTMLAEALDISPQYLSRVFKQEAGCNMLEYVNRLRIETVKQLLETTDNSEAVIAAKVGYTNDKTLIRVFKQYEGITPGQYRLDHKKE